MPGEDPHNIWNLTSQGKTWPTLGPRPRGSRPKPQPASTQALPRAPPKKLHNKLTWRSAQPTGKPYWSDSCSPTQQLFCCNCSQSSQPFCLRLKPTCQYPCSIAAQLQQEGTQPTQRIPQEHLAQMSKGHCATRPHRTPSILDCSFKTGKCNRNT